MTKKKCLPCVVHGIVGKKTYLLINYAGRAALNDSFFFLFGKNKEEALASMFGAEYESYLRDHRDEMEELSESDREDPMDIEQWSGITLHDGRSLVEVTDDMIHLGSK
jgi:hypothetical protein